MIEETREGFFEIMRRECQGDRTAVALTLKRRASFAEVAEVVEEAGEAEGDQNRVRLKGAVMRWY